MLGGIQRRTPGVQRGDTGIGQPPQRRVSGHRLRRAQGEKIVQPRHLQPRHLETVLPPGQRGHGLQPVVLARPGFKAIGAYSVA
jgi:hypothetical protein